MFQLLEQTDRSNHDYDWSVFGKEEELVVWTSTMVRTGETVAPMTASREVSDVVEPEPTRLLQ